MNGEDEAEAEAAENAEGESVDRLEADPEHFLEHEDLPPPEPLATLDDYNSEGEQGLDFVDSLFAAATSDLSGITGLEDL